jgi:hypothetical protein
LAANLALGTQVSIAARYGSNYYRQLRAICKYVVVQTGI